MPYTTQQLLDLIDTNIRQSSSLDRITAAETRAVLNPFIEELSRRGLFFVAATIDLLTLDGDDSQFVFLYGTGILVFDDTSPAPNGTTVFPGAGGSWVLIAGTVNGANVLSQLQDVLGVGWSPEDGDTLVYDASINLWRPATGGSTGKYYAPLWSGGSIPVGSNIFTNGVLVGASEINYIIVNKVIEFIGDDYTFDPVLGKVTRTNQFQAGDKMITPYKK